MVAPSRFEELATPHLAASYNLAYWITRSRTDAEDVVQEAYLRAWRSFDGFRGEAICPWLLAIVRNAAYRWMSTRRQGGNVVSLDTAFIDAGGDRVTALDLPSEARSAEEELIARSEHDRLTRALAALAPAFREILVLREIEGMSYRDIATVTGTQAGTVMSRLSRARAGLRRVLNEDAERGMPHAL